MKLSEVNRAFLDHIAIKVGDMERSINWYETVLGLQKVQLEAWSEVPVFMLAGKTGVAIFPAKGEVKENPDILIHDFTFYVDHENFEVAQRRYDALGVDYDFQDHYDFHSFYTHHPDGHRVELTTQIKTELK